MIKFKFKKKKNKKHKITALTVQIPYNLQNHPTFQKLGNGYFWGGTMGLLQLRHNNIKLWETRQNTQEMLSEKNNNCLIHSLHLKHALHLKSMAK